MSKFPKKLAQKLAIRAENDALRSLPIAHNAIDFSSNDYLGFAKNETIYAHTFQLLLNEGIAHNGASGSRLLTGNHNLYGTLERYLAEFHKAESALVFNSGYDANMGFFSTVPQRGDIVFYDAHIHASIRDGIKMGLAKSYKFAHNDIEDLKAKCLAQRSQNAEEVDIYVVTESIFSMDGDAPNLKAMAKFCATEGFHLIVDEAHAVGVFGENGCGLVQELAIEKQVFARIVTFGKAVGCHGAAVLGSDNLKRFLLNFARSFIYTTGLPPHAVASIIAAYNYLGMEDGLKQLALLQTTIALFKSKVQALHLEKHFLESDSAIQVCIVPGNSVVKELANKLFDDGLDVKAILSPTVSEGQERLRICLHSHNNTEEIVFLLQRLKSYL